MAALTKAPPSEASYDDYDDDEEPRGLITTAINLALRPVRPFISRPALRAYLTTLFAVLTAITLLILATIAYILFYNIYIPRIGFSRPLHLQYDHILITNHQQHSPQSIEDLKPYPWASTTLAPEMTSAQAYDITLSLTLPNTPSNLEAGNFMLDIQLLASSSALTPSADPTILARTRLPALIPYRSRLVYLTQTLLALPYYILGFRSESTTLSIPAFSQVEFPKGWRSTPSTLRLEVQSIHVLQIETAKVEFRARFRGLRWVMYNHRFISGVVFVSMFWGVECLFAGIAWGFISLYFSSSASKDEKVEMKAKLRTSGEEVKRKEIKDEPAAMSDTERTFPSRTGSGVVSYSSPDVKKEIKEEPDVLYVPEHVAKAAEADVEDEGEDSDQDLSFRDSGIGTSLESEASLQRRDSMRRRRQGRGRTESKD